MTMLSYLNFDLEIEGARKKYKATVLGSPAGSAASTAFTLPFTDSEIGQFLLKYRGHQLRLDDLKEFGGALFKAVFAKNVLKNFKTSLDVAHSQDKKLRIRLRLKPAELAELPWEYIYDQTTNHFLFLSTETTLMRYIDLPERTPLKINLPIRVLVMISNPKDMPALDVEQEWINLREAVKGLMARGQIEIERLDPPTLDVLRQRLRQQDYHVFHFIGHGGFDERTQEGRLLLEDEESQGYMLSGEQLGTLMYDEKSLRLAVLNVCDGARVSQMDPFDGVAQSLVQQRVPAVIAMQTSITDLSAIEFAREFYTALSDGYPVDAALAEARKAIYLHNAVEWGTPVLYTCSREGNVLEIAPEDEQPAPVVNIENKAPTDDDRVTQNEQVSVKRAEEQNVQQRVEDIVTRKETIGQSNDQPLTEATSQNVNEQASQPTEPSDSPDTTPEQTANETQFWVLADNLEQYNWSSLQAGQTFTYEVQRRADRQYLMQVRSDDPILLVDTKDVPSIKGIGGIHGQTIDYSYERQGSPIRAKIQLVCKLVFAVSQENVKPALGDDLDIGPQPSFLPMAREHWTVIRDLILYYNQYLELDALPPPTAPPIRKIEVRTKDMPRQFTADERVSLSIVLRNTGNVTWNMNETLLVANSWSRGIIWSWKRRLTEDVPPGGRAVLTDLAGKVPSEPGSYNSTWSVKVPTWEDQAGPYQYIIGSVRVVTASKQQIIQTAEGQPPSPAANEASETANTEIVNQEVVSRAEAEPVREVVIPETIKPVGPSQTALEALPQAEVATAPAEPLQPATSPHVITGPQIINVSPYKPPPTEFTIRVHVASDVVSLTYDNNIYTSPNLIRQGALLEAASPLEYGKLLFDSIIHEGASQGGHKNSTLHGFDYAVNEAQGELRFELVVDSTLGAYKWEYLVDPRDEARPIASLEKSPFYRRLGNSNKRPSIANKLNILVAICNPATLGRNNDDEGKKVNDKIAGLVKLDVAGERDIIVRALERLRKAGLADYHIMDGESSPVTLEALEKESKNDYNVLHLLAHGLFINDKYQLVMERDDRHHRFIPAERFCEILKGKGLRLVVLAACQSATSETGSALKALGPSLVREDIPAVIAMQDEVRVDTAQFFTQRFYDDLARSGRVDMAMAATRFALYQRNLGEWQWGIPVLMMSTDDGQLFEVDQQRAAELPPFRPEIKTYPDLAPAKFARAVESAANIYRAGPEVVGARTSDEPLAQPQNRQALGERLKQQVKLRAAELKTYVEESGSKLALPLSVYGQIASALNAGKHVILIGPPGTGKTSLAHDICEYARHKGFTTGSTLTTATADWTAFDTVGGYVPTAQQTLQFRPGIFLQAICAGHWLVIDEINRAEIDKAFGELFTVLSGQQADLPYLIGQTRVRVLPPAGTKPDNWLPQNGEGLTGYDYVIHPNWRILATMNVYDKSYLFAMSFAFMRRFAFVDVELPDQTTYKDLIERWSGPETLLQTQPVRDMLAKLREMLKDGNSLMNCRALGPAIVKDMICYMGDRIGDDDQAIPLEIMGEAFLLYVTPQLDGLDREAITSVYIYIDTLFEGSAMTKGVLARIRSLYPHIPSDEWEARLKESKQKQGQGNG
jgi:CHAT domain-containing protein/MoxR-like ATPase